MRHSFKLKRSITAFCLAGLLIAIPNNDFTIKVFAEETSMEENATEQYPQNLSQYLKAVSAEDETMIRAMAVDKAKQDAQDQIAQAEAEAAEKAKKEAEEKAAKEKEQKKLEEEKRAAEEKRLEEEKKTEEERKANEAEQAVYLQLSNGYLLAISDPDTNYSGCSVSLSEEDRYILEHLVAGEAQNQGFTGAALVAQTIRDRLVYDGYTSVESVRVKCGYYGSLNVEPNEDVIAAVSYIFDQGGSAVQHKIRFFYAYTWSYSGWHETMDHIVTYGDHKFFDKW